MSSGDFFGLWLHIIGMAVYAGSTVALIFVVLPAAKSAATPEARRSFLAAALRIYDPLAIAALGFVLWSGATNLTTFKDNMRGEFFARMGWLLVWKLVLAFLVLMIGVYLAMGLGHRIVRSEGLQDPVDDAWLTSMQSRLYGTGILVLILVAITAWLGLAMGHPGSPTP